MGLTGGTGRRAGWAGWAGRADRRSFSRPRIRRSSRDRRADHRPAGREAGGAGRGAQRAAAHHPDSRLARSRCSACWMAERVRYRADVLEQLLAHGIRPTEQTEPELVRDFVRDLYKYEIRRLRERYLQRSVSEDRIRGPGRRPAPALSGAGAAAARVSSRPEDVGRQKPDTTGVSHCFGSIRHLAGPVVFGVSGFSRTSVRSLEPSSRRIVRTI